MKLLVHCNYETAIRATKLLGLDPEEWKPCGYMDMLGGEQFEQIVVIYWSSRVTSHVRQWMEEDLPLKLPQGKRVEFL
jgi:hypothetical protein